MTCFQASGLGGRDFCAEACDPSQSPADAAHYACVASGASGALARRCHPSSSSDPQADCPQGLNCYRTSLVADTGLCIRMPVCAQDADCLSATYNICATSLVRSLSSSAAALLRLDHLNCVHAGCSALQSSCASSEGCLATQYSSPVDICAPNCDSKQQCPPNFSCVRATSGAGSPNLCVPGLPGERCDGDHCVLGRCEDTGAGFSVCTIPCASDTDCAPLGKTDVLVCVEGAGHRHCVATRTFDGANCDTTDQCKTDRNESCVHVDRWGMTSSRGECRVPCNRDGTCDPQGGVAHGCLAGSCYPGIVDIPCTRDSECVPPLTCHNVPPEADNPAGGSRICTLPCAMPSVPQSDFDSQAPGVTEVGPSEAGSDADPDSLCAPPPLSGYCGGGFCRVARVPGKPCSRPAQCNSGLCDGATNACLPRSNTAGGP